MENNGFHDGYIVETTDEEGQKHIFEKVDEFEVDGQQYALLIYLGTGEDTEEKEEGYEEEVVVMRVTKEDDGEVYEAIEDEEEFERVIQCIELVDEEDEDDDDDDEEDEDEK